MHFTQLTSIVTLAVLAAAAPHPVEQETGIAIPITKRSRLVNADKSVNIEALNAQVASTRAKILRGFDNFEKNTGAPHPAAPTGVQRRGTGNDALIDNQGEMWYGTISVGTPATHFTVDFDTGSSDLFLPASQCTSNCDGHTRYDPSASSTSQDLGQTFTLSYGDGSTLDGEVYSDTVIVSGLTATGQALGAARDYSSSLAINRFPSDGLMGMAFQSISGFNSPPVFQTLVTDGQTDQPVFSFKLAATGSELYLGGANSELYTGDFTYTPVTQAGYWQVNMDGIVGNEEALLSNIESIIDTGTTVIVGPPSQVAELSQKLGGTDASSTAGQGFYTFPCNSFPSVSLTFGGKAFPISADTLNLGPVFSGSNDCVSGITGGNTPSSLWVIGDVFLQNVYTTFDVGRMQVGFAQLA